MTLRRMQDAMAHLRWAVVLLGWATLFLPCWLIAEGVERSLRWLADTQSPSGY